MAAFGSFALLLALALAAYNLFAGTAALRLLASGRPARISSDRLADTARRAGIASFVAVTAAAVALVWSALTNDFTITYIAEHSNRALPAPYKFAALWSGQEGSLLLWAWLLGGYGFILRLTHETEVRLYAYAGTILAAVEVFFLAIVNFAAPPFSLLKGAIPDDGNGLNPLLQYPEMVIHPPLLYLGYVGFTIPFAFALGALMMRYPGETWIKVTRRWTLVSWLFLSLGIVVGMHWAYGVLGWGGYWGWDPVENASLMPWLTGTAFLHSVMMQERKGMMKSWNIWLIFATFMLSILGTLLTRGGLVSSVHAFAQSSLGTWFMVFLAIVLAVCVLTYIFKRNHLKSEQRIESLVSRESSFLFNNLVLLTACFVILWGTLFPILSEFVEGSKITVGAPFFDRVAVPIGIFLLFLTGVGPLLPWRAASLRAIRRNFLLPSLAVWATVIGGTAAGVRPWRAGTFDIGRFYALAAFALAAGVLTAILSEFLRGAGVIARQTSRNLFAAIYLLIRRNTRRYGGYIVHIGVVVAMIGLAGAAFNRNVEGELALHDRLGIGPYTLENVGVSQDTNANYNSDSVLLDIYRGGKKAFQVAPGRRAYLASDQPQTMAAIHSGPGGDLYVIYEGTDSDTGHPIIKALLNPLVGWIWTGLVFIVFGTLVALTPSLTPVAATVRMTASRTAPAEAALKGGD